uniref:Putative secreted protein n=1 Tax=Anopheles triannulatus TaxID=58253 RepID=A0A2M4B547_9DIPT
MLNRVIPTRCLFLCIISNVTSQCLSSIKLDLHWMEVLINLIEAETFSRTPAALALSNGKEHKEPRSLHLLSIAPFLRESV